MISLVHIEARWPSDQKVLVHVDIVPSLLAPPKDVARPINGITLVSREKFCAFLREITAPALPDGEIKTACLASNLASLLRVLGAEPPYADPVPFDC